MSIKVEDNWEHWDFCIRSAGNTGTKCLMTIRQKGYKIRIYYIEKDEQQADYISFFEAKKNGHYFSAINAEELLGLIAMWEVRGDNWREVTEEEMQFCESLQEDAEIINEHGEDVSEN